MSRDEPGLRGEPPQPAGPGASSPDRAVGFWLLLCAALVLTMVWLGGVTRLTRSGLSIVEWKPVTGLLPPIGEAAWAAELERYRATPEARLVNVGITLDQFQSIFWVEYAHRLLGRTAGAVFLLPLVWFWRKRRLSPRAALALLSLLALGGLQGAVGWWMVKSGLVDAPMVSPYRLAAHLGLALVLLCGLLWLSLDRLSPGPGPERPSTLFYASLSLLPLVSLTLGWGALTAGMHAGLLCPTFPLMFGGFFPPGLLERGEGLSVLFRDPMAVQFAHRTLAFSTGLGALVVAALGVREGGAARRRAIALAAAVAAQITLGALVVMRSVPISLASMHQANGALVLALLVALVHASRPSGGATSAAQRTPSGAKRARLAATDTSSAGSTGF